MKLERYHEKRRFTHTPEPKGKVKNTASSHLFVVQKHNASHLHYDFRLEVDGVLKSWAIPKGPSLDPHVKRLAVQVEDHPLEYGNFEGVIPPKQYGSGVVMVWDTGTWHETEESQANKKKEDIKFVLEGEKLKGKWALVKIKSDPKNWLLIKSQDDEAVSQDKYDILEEDNSVLSGRSTSQIAKDNDDVWTSNKVSKKATKTKRESAAIQKIKKTKLPADVKPQLATLVEKPPSGEEWLHEMKYDGYRLICHIQNDRIKLTTRNNHDWTEKFDKIEREINKLALQDCILDGEVVAIDKQGLPNFQLLQNSLNKNVKAQLVYYVFDILYYKGKNVTSLALIERKKLLKSIIAQSEGLIRFSEYIQGDGDDVFQTACELGFEGIISKNIHSSYAQKRTKTWLKSKCISRQEFVIGGFTKPKGERGHFGALLLGYYDKHKTLHYCGRVGTGFTDATLKTLYELLSKNLTKKCPFEEKPPEKDIAGWVKPNIVVEVEFTEWTQDNALRHPSFKGVRKDKKPTQIAKEEAQDKAEPIKSQQKISLKEIEITHPERIVYPALDITKQQVVEYYLDVQQWILPHIMNRPLAIVRCPDGVNGESFFQKHLSNKKTTQIFNGDKYIYIENAQGLLQLIQFGTLEIHLWGAHVNKIDNPDMITFDLDPGPGVPWKKVVDTALLMKQELEEFDLTSFVKTSGGKGLHVVVPLLPRYDWDEVKEFSKLFASYMTKKYAPDYIDVMSKSKRNNKIFIDYLRNGKGASAIAPYSTRANEKGAIAVPLAWDELSVRIKPDTFILENIHKRLSKQKADPWRDFFLLKQKLPKID